MVQAGEGSYDGGALSSGQNKAVPSVCPQFSISILPQPTSAWYRFIDAIVSAVSSSFILGSLRKAEVGQAGKSETGR